jgi:hypothetical protein
VSPDAGRYVVLQQVGPQEWRVVGEIGRRPGLPARRSRGQAIRDVLGREQSAHEQFAVLPRSEWLLSLKY